MDIAFADAMRPAQCVILRLLMCPYSLGHELLLLQKRNPLVTLSESEFANLADEQKRLAIIQATLICCQNWKQNQKPHRWLRLWGRLIRKAGTDLAVAEFRSYRESGTLLPRLVAPEEKGRTLGSSHLVRIFNFGFSMYGQAVYDQPLGLLQFLYFGAIEFEGNCQVENATERQIREEMAQHDADYAREQQEAKCQA